MKHQDTIGRQETVTKVRDVQKAKGWARLEGTFTSYLNRYTALCLFVLVLVIYNLNARSIPSGDTVPAALLPFSLLEYHSMNFDHFIQYYHNQSAVTYFFWDRQGQMISAYPVVTGLLATPIYVIPYLLVKLAGIPVDLNDHLFITIVDVMEKLSASIIVALASCVLYLAMKRIFSKKIAIAGALIFALCTSMWTIGSQALWQHGTSSLLFCVLLYLIFSNEKKSRNINAVCMGIVSGLYAFNRPSDSLMLLPVILYLLFKGARSLGYFVVSATAITVPFACYNYYFFGSPLGGYSQVTSMFNPGNITVGFAGLLISPSRGLLIYTPVVLLAIPGYLKISMVKNVEIRRFLYICGVGVLAELLLYSAWDQWHGGCSYGPRFLTVLQPVLAIYIALFLSGLSITKAGITRKNAIIVALVAILVLISFTVQLIGATCLTNGGYLWDASMGRPGALWDFQDTQIGRCVNAGPGDFKYYRIIDLILFSR